MCSKFHPRGIGNNPHATDWTRNVFYPPVEQVYSNTYRVFFSFDGERINQFLHLGVGPLIKLSINPGSKFHWQCSWGCLPYLHLPFLRQNADRCINYISFVRSVWHIWLLSMITSFNLYIDKCKKIWNKKVLRIMKMNAQKTSCLLFLLRQLAPCFDHSFFTCRSLWFSSPLGNLILSPALWIICLRMLLYVRM